MIDVKGARKIVKGFKIESKDERKSKETGTKRPH